MKNKAHTIPVGLNLWIAGVSITASAGLLWTASHASSWMVILLAAWAFSFVNNTNFSLLHEAVHGNFHPRRRVNNWAGRLFAAFYPTGFQFQRQCHLGHHARNRSEVEQFDYIRPEDNKVWKYLTWYTILTGLYWFFVVLGWVVFLVCPWLLRLKVFDADHSQVAAQSSTDAMLNSMFNGPATVMRLELLMTIGIQAGLFLILDLTWSGWLVCYACFALRWSALQYADHAWTELDTLDGAWNLKVNRVVRYLFLNYHFHKVHHQQPSIPWLYLPDYVEPGDEQPTFLSIYLKMWRGPRPLPEGLVNLKAGENS